MASGAVDVAWSWQDGVVLFAERGYPVGFQRAPKEGSSTFFCGYINLKNGPGKGSQRTPRLRLHQRGWRPAAKGLLDTIGYGHTRRPAMETIWDEKAGSRENLSRRSMPGSPRPRTTPHNVNATGRVRERSEAGFF